MGMRIKELTLKGLFEKLLDLILDTRWKGSDGTLSHGGPHSSTTTASDPLADHPRRLQGAAHLANGAFGFTASTFIFHARPNVSPISISATHKPIHSPAAPHPRLKHRKYPSGSPTPQYAARCVNMGVRVSPAPRSAPVETVCTPSKSWNAAATASSVTPSFITP